MSLTPAQIRAFEADGYLIVRGLLPRAALDPLIHELEDAVEGQIREAVERSLLPAADTFPDAPFERRLALVAQASDDPSFFWRELHGKQHKTAGMFALRTSSTLLDAVESLIGPEIYAHPQTVVRPKLPNMRGAAVPWHQDLAYLLADEAAETRIVNCWIPLVRADAQSGCLQVIAGSHRAGLVAHDAEVDTWIGIADAEVPPGPIITCELEVGDVLMTTERLVHRSLPHSSDRVRWSLDTRYCRIGEPTGRDHKPGFIARSRQQPDRVARSHHAWIRAFEDAGLDWTEKTWKGLPPALRARAVRVKTLPEAEVERPDPQPDPQPDESAASARLSPYYEGLSSQRLAFRRLQLSDCPAWEAFYHDNPSLALLNIDLDRTPQTMARAWITHQFDRYDNQAFGHLAITRKSDGALLGTGGLKWNDYPYDGHRPLAVMMTLIPAHWGKGYAQEAFATLFDATFESGWAPSIYAFIHHENHASIRSCQRVRMHIVETRPLAGRLTTVMRLDASTWHAHREATDGGRDDR